MGNKWTKEQLDAITERDCNLLVAAAAGAGKTAVLVERIIRKITDEKNPVDIDRLLVVTFTNAAATEMRERIGNALAEALDKDPSSANLQKQMTLLDRASIMTLHSFCLEVVRSHFHALDLDPLFRIADETESALIRLDALDQLFEDKYENEDKDSMFFKLVEGYGGGRDDNSLREIILTLHRFISSYPWPEQWLSSQAEAYNAANSDYFNIKKWTQVLLKGADAELQGIKALLERTADQAGCAEGLEPYCGALEADIEAIDRMLSLCRKAIRSQEAAGSDADAAWDEFHDALGSFEPIRLPRCGKNADKDAQEEVKTARKLMKDKIKKLYSGGFDATSAEIREDLGRLYPVVKYLSEMVSEFDARYRQKKKDKGLLDFNDLEHYCLQVLFKDGVPTAAAKELRERYEEILIDEYQDSNLIQELIISAVSGNDDGRFNIFMVGDVKQSIYRFRQAMPELFLSKYLNYHREIGHENRVIQLFKNFRSRREVINGVNFIFRQIMSEEVGELDYTENEYLSPGAEFPVPGDNCTVGGPVEIHILDLSSQKDEIIPGASDVPEADTASDQEERGAEKDAGSAEPAAVSDDNANSGESSRQAGEGEANTEDEESLDNIQYEARIVGHRIKSLVTHEPGGFSVYDKKTGGYRPVEYKDIVILMRATRNWGDVFVDELAQMGIPVYADTGLGYFRTVEVETMLSLLQIIDNPLQDIPMLAVLRSPIGGFSTDDLADIRLADRSASIYEAMVKLAGMETGDSDEGEEEKSAEQPDVRDAVKSSEPADESDAVSKTRKFLTSLKRWRDASLYLPVDELVWQLMIETGYYSYAGALPGGDGRQANLRMLFERARQFEETSYRGLFNFINFINKLRSGGGDMGSAKILGENDNVVRIMSIHKSKGLEFPVVIVAGCGKKFNMQDLNPAILLHQNLGFGPDLVDLDKRTVMPSLPKYAIRQKLRMETLSEEMRVLYVAFTRAKEKLIITGSVRDHEKACAAWCKRAADSDAKLSVYDMMQATSYLDWIGPAVARHASARAIRMLAGSADTGALINGIDDNDVLLEIKLWGTGASKLGKSEQEAAESIKDWLSGPQKESDGQTAEQLKEQEAGQMDEYEQTNEIEQVIKALDWKYPYNMLSRVPAKISVTELKRRSLMEENTDSAEPFVRPMMERPLFMEPDKELSAAHKGTVMHFVMQHLDLEKLAAAAGMAYATDGSAHVTEGLTHVSGGLAHVTDGMIHIPDGKKHMPAEVTNASDGTSCVPADTAFTGSGNQKSELIDEIRRQISVMREKELLTEAEAESVRVNALAAFFGSSFGKRMLALRKSVHRETAFTIELKCSEVSWTLAEGEACEEMMLLQGVIDCWFEDSGGLVLLDYKTDYVPHGQSEIIKERYKTQIEYYTKALQKITGKKVAERYLYLFYNGELLSC